MIHGVLAWTRLPSLILLYKREVGEYASCLITPKGTSTPHGNEKKRRFHLNS